MTDPGKYLPKYQQNVNVTTANESVLNCCGEICICCALPFACCGCQQCCCTYSLQTSYGNLLIYCSRISRVLWKIQTFAQTGVQYDQSLLRRSSRSRFKNASNQCRSSRNHDKRQRQARYRCECRFQSDKPDNSSLCVGD
jgi:hypothetical protein